MDVQEAKRPSLSSEAQRPLHVLHIYRRFHPDYTGDGIYYTRLLPLLQREGVTGEYLAYETEPPGPGATHVHEGQRVTYLTATRFPATTFGLGLWLLRNLGRFDLIHLHSHVDRYFITYMLARVFGRPVIYSCTLNDSPTQLAAEYSEKYRRVALMLMRVISAFVVISPHLLRRSLETMPEERLHFIPQGIVLNAPPPGPTERAAARAQLGLAPADFLLLNVGSLSRRKNLVFLIEALALIPDGGVRLVLVGPALEEDYTAEMKARITALGLEARVMLVGFHQDMPAYYAAADAFVFASTAEGFPNVFLEAMAAGLPIVTRFLPGLTDFVIEHGRTGFLADRPAEFAASIARLRDAPELRAEMGRLSRQFADRNLEIGCVARAYASLYRGQIADARPGAASTTAFRDFENRFTAKVATGPAAIGLREFDLPASEPPLLQVVIDTEAGFEWDKGIWTDVGQVDSIVGLRDRFDVFRRHGVRPALVVDHPIITGGESARIIRDLAAEGCEVGVHLHAWSTPPVVGPMDDWHSFSGNLGPSFERLKLETLTRRVEEAIGHRPRTFKSGRYGLGPNTVESLLALGFTTDLSICPAFDYSAMGGPDFRRFSSRAGWFGPPGGLLSLPTTSGWLGWASGPGERFAPLLGSRLGHRLRLPRIAARTNALYPVRLSPEGNSLNTIKRLTRELHRKGLRVFTLSLHSPTLQAGNTPYTRSDAELTRLVADIDAYLAFFRDEIGGQFASPGEIRTRLIEADPACRSKGS